MGGAPNKACHSFGQSILPSNCRLSHPVGLVIRFHSAARRTKRAGQVGIAMSSVLGLIGVIALLVRLHVQSLPMEIQIDDFSHIIGKYSEIPRDDRRSNVSPGL